MTIIIRGKSICPICGHVLLEQDRLVATSHFIGDQSDPLWRFSDAGMHYSCFQGWPHRDSFIEKYNRTLGQCVWGNGTRHHMLPDGTIEILPAVR